MTVAPEPTAPIAADVVAAPDSTDPLDVLDRLLAAVVAGDVEAARAIYHADAVIWHSNDGVEQPAEDNLAVLGWMAKNLPGLRYENVRRYPIPGGAVEQHDTVVPIPGVEDPLVMPACLIVQVDIDGQITRLDEYIDSQAVEQLVAAIGAKR